MGVFHWTIGRPSGFHPFAISTGRRVLLGRAVRRTAAESVNVAVVSRIVNRNASSPTRSKLIAS
jgi:hypothetical protein